MISEEARFPPTIARPLTSGKPLLGALKGALAEGVEREKQLAALVHEGCDEVQGHLIGRPRPAEHYRRIVGGARPKIARTPKLIGENIRRS